MEDDFYATIKFKNGEEIFAKVAVSEEEDRTMLVLSNPVRDAKDILEKLYKSNNNNKKS